MAKKPRPEDLLDWIGLTDAPDWKLARPYGRLIGFVVSAVLIFVPILVIFALIAAFVVVIGTSHQVWTGAGGPNLGAGALIAAILGAPFVIWGTVIKHRQLGFQKEGHITDRISKAVEQLGAEKVVKIDGEERSEPNIEVRIGGLLSLERISQDSVAYDKGRDHVRVMEILCAYIRNNAPASGAKRSLRDLWQTDQDAAGPNHAPASEEQFKELHRIHPLDDLDDFISPEATADWASRLPKPREDIQLALSILGRRDADQRRHEARWGKDDKPDADWGFDTPCPALPEADEAALTEEALDTYRRELSAWENLIGAYAGYRLDLRGSNFQGADLSFAILSGARLDEARMEGADLGRARMEGADLGGARMEGADLGGARMEGVKLRQAWMEGAKLRQARMVGAKLGRARMEGANLWKARMEVADLSRARMEGTKLWQVRMEGASLWQARMEGADLRQVRMEGAKLRQARMERTNLEEARMEGTNLWQARMEGADLSWARMDTSTSLSKATFQGAALREVDYHDVKLTADQISAAFGDASVIRPEGLPNPAHWPDWELPDNSDDPNDFHTQWRKWQADPDAYVPPPPPDPAPDAS